MSELRKRGIETRTFFYPLHSQPVIRDLGYAPNESFPVAESLAEGGLYLPSGSGLAAEQIVHVCDTIKEISRLYE